MFFRPFKFAQHRPARRVPSSLRSRPLTVEFLEGRTVPATVTVVPGVELGLSSAPAQVASDTLAVATTGAWIGRHGLTSAQYQLAFNTYVGKGYRLIDVSGYEVSGQA